MRSKGVLPCRREGCTREAITTHVIGYRGLRFHLPVCEEHGAELQALEGTEAPITESRASEEVIRITHGQETIAQICYTHRCPAITIDFPGEAPPAEEEEGNRLPSTGSEKQAGGGPPDQSP
jgi:hypothetical protein